MEFSATKHNKYLKFCSEAKVLKHYQSQHSIYYKITIKDMCIKLCLSDHFGEYRKGYTTIITKNKGWKSARFLAFEYFENKKKNKF